MENIFCPVPCLFPILFIAFIIFISILSHQGREKQKAAWRQFATAHNLHYSSGGSYFGIGDEVTGIYRGYPLRLGIAERNQGKSNPSYTQITITVPQTLDYQPDGQPQQPLSFREAVNRLNLPSLQYKWGLEIRAEKRGQKICYEQPGIIEDVQYIEYLFDLLISLVEAYPVIVNWGGEAIPILQALTQNRVLHPFIMELLRDIAQGTSKRLGYRASHLLCPKCLTFFGPHRVDLSWWNTCTYYSCRICGQSQNFYEGPVVAVLDSQTTDKSIQSNSIIRVNWSTQRQLFDFDAVEIDQASDEEVERFAVQVGNDTDETRASRYEEMQCVVLPGCQLSDNTLRILRRTFGQIIIGDEGSWRSKEFVTHVQDKCTLVSGTGFGPR